MPDAAREFRQAGAVHELLAPFCFATGDGMVLAKNGDLCLAFRLEGMDYQCRNPEELDRGARRFETALRGLPANIRVYQYVLKRCQKTLPRSSYQNPVLEQAIGQRLAWMEQRGEVLYQLESYIVLCLERWQAAGRRLAPRSAAVLLESKLVEAAELLGRRAQIFRAQVADVFALEPLGAERTFRLLARLVNPDPAKAAWLPLRDDRPLDVQLAASAIDCYRTHLRIDNYFVQALALKEMPARTSAHLFRDLFEIQANLHVALEWRREEAEKARRILQMKRRHYHNQKFSIWSYLSTREAANPEDLLLDDSAKAMFSNWGPVWRRSKSKGRRSGSSRSRCWCSIRSRSGCGQPPLR